MRLPLRFAPRHDYFSKLFTMDMTMILETSTGVASQGNPEAAIEDSIGSPLTFAIPGLTRNPGCISGFPLSRE
jgi:hypothetical protein